MARSQTRSSGLFSGLVLLTVGVLLLLHNYSDLDFGSFFVRWWPLLIIFWGAVKLYERTAGRRFGGGGGAITSGEVLLVIGMLALLGVVVAVEYGHRALGDKFRDLSGDNYSFDLDVAPKTIPARAPVLIHTFRGDVTVRASDDADLRVSAKKNIRTWSETEADRMGKPVRLEIAQNGDGFQVQPAGYDPSNARIGVDLDISVPRKSPVTVKTEKGDVQISDIGAAVSVSDGNGDVEVHTSGGDVSIAMTKGDVKVDDTKGDVRISGKGGEVEVTETSGSVTVEGDFYGPIRADHAMKGVRVNTTRTSLTLASLDGHLEAGSGSLELVDARGNVDLRTRNTEVNVENASGKVYVDNRNAQTTVRFSSTPKDDVQITNSSAGISLTLPGTASFEIQADCRNCDIESEFPSLNATKNESGDSHLSGKSGSGNGPKITLKTSYGNIQLRRNVAAVPAPPHVPAPPSPRVPVVPKVPAPPTVLPPSTEQ